MSEAKRNELINPSGSRLFDAAQRLFHRENKKDEAAMWNFIVAGRDLPEEPAGLRVQRWIARRWGYDVAQDYGTVPPIAFENTEHRRGD